MESLSRPRHGRKHSRNPYGDVFLSTGPERETLDAHEYAEIFSGSSSIPVLDLSALDEPVGSGISRDSKLDYSSIFGGDAGDDLSNGSAKKAQRRNPTDERVISQESDSSNSDNSTDEPKKQFNVSLKRNINTSNGKTHIAQLQAVPGFTHFVEEAPPKTDSGKNVNSLKREVNRTWSFKADAEAIKGKKELSREKSRVPDNKSQPKASYFVPKNDALEDHSGEFSPPFYGEEFDENSIAAASAAALKRAIDQAQESIRLAKMIMDRKKEGYQIGSKARQKGHSKVSGKDSDSKKKKMKDKNAELDHAKFNEGMNGKSAPSFISAAKTEVESVSEYAADGEAHVNVYIDEKIELKKAEENVEAVEAGNSTPSLVYDDAFISAAKIEVESVCENAAEGKGDVKVSSNGIQGELVYIDEKIDLEKTKNVEAVGVHSGEADFPLLSDNECKEENLELSVAHAQGTEVVAEQVERELDASSQRIQELKMNVEEAEDCEATIDHGGEPENKVEKVVNTPQRIRRHWNVLGKACKYFGIGQEDRLSERENDVEDKGTKEPGEVTNVESVTKLMWQVETEKEPERRESDNVLKTHDDEGNICFGSDEQLKEALEREINQDVFPEIEEGEKSVDEVHEPEVDFQKENHVHGEVDQNLPGEVEQNEAEEEHINTSECEVPDTIETGEKDSAQVQTSAVVFDSEENRVNCQNEDDAYEELINEAVDVNTSSSSDTQEACNVDQTVVENREENFTVPEVMETFSEINKDQDEEPLSHQENDTKIPGSETLRRVLSEEIFVESELHNDSDSLSSDGSKIENGSLTGAEEELPEDEVLSNATETDDVDQGFMSQVESPHPHASDVRTSEFDAEGVEQVSEEASGSDESSLSTSSSHENLNGFSAHDSEECEETPNGMNPINGESKDEVSLVSNEGKDTKPDNSKDKDMKVGEPQNSDRDDDYQQRIEAIKRGRQKEKDRKAVERAIREVRERAFAEARETAERAAVEKASAEARQRALSEAREKASHVKQQVVVDKDSSIRAKLRAERAAVERATAEARERALKKAVSMKTIQTEGKAEAEKGFGSSRSNGLKHSFSSSDLDNGTETTQRHKAKLEKNDRIKERAQKALAEKNMRDFLAQKEQDERNRLAESLDGDIKRWAMGKEKNLRALLSTLQYILGADSGWQPIHMTDIVTTPAVKKAYRKATLCVHPDKLQQRGATIKQKYICEKVFDLLKAAWNRYESDDR